MYSYIYICSVQIKTDSIARQCGGMLQTSCDAVFPSLSIQSAWYYLCVLGMAGDVHVQKTAFRKLPLSNCFQRGSNERHARRSSRIEVGDSAHTPLPAHHPECASQLSGKRKDVCIPSHTRP